jgi:hypothetical protein
MAVEKKDFKPGEIPTSIVRGNISSHRIASSLSTREIQISSASNRTPEEAPFANIDSFATKKTETTEENKNNLDKKTLDDQINIKENTAKEHENANNKAQSVLVYLFREVFPEGLNFFNRSNQIAQNPQQAAEIAKEDFGRITEKPEKILQVLKDVIPAKIAEMKSKANASGNQDDIKHYDRVDEILGRIFDVTNQLDGKGSHTALLGLIESLDQSKIQGDLKGLISDYHNSLSALGNQIKRANAQLLNRTRHPQSELITGVTTKIDQGLRASLYTRPESLGAAHRDHLGGIMGSIYDFKDTDWTLGGTPWEYGINVKGSETASATPFPVRRLAGEMRGYIGTLTEAQPGPMFVTTDVDAKLRNTEMRNA